MNPSPVSGVGVGVGDGVGEGVGHNVGEGLGDRVGVGVSSEPGVMLVIATATVDGLPSTG